MADEPEPVETDAEPDDEAEAKVTDADVRRAARSWRELAPPRFRDLIDADEDNSPARG
jgi:hypothetical protein